MLQLKYDWCLLLLTWLVVLYKCSKGKVAMNEGQSCGYLLMLFDSSIILNM